MTPGVGTEIHFLTVLDAFAFPAAVIGFKFGDLRIARLEGFLDDLLCWHPVRSWLISYRQIQRPC